MVVGGVAVAVAASAGAASAVVVDLYREENSRRGDKENRVGDRGRFQWGVV